MKIYYSFDMNRIMTEEEAIKYVKEEILDDDYAIWEFISDNCYYDEIIENLPQDFLKDILEENPDWDFYSYGYCCNEIIENLSQDFLKDVKDELIKRRLENPDYFLIREIPD